MPVLSTPLAATAAAASPVFFTLTHSPGKVNPALLHLRHVAFSLFSPLTSSLLISKLLPLPSSFDLSLFGPLLQLSPMTRAHPGSVNQTLLHLNLPSFIPVPAVNLPIQLLLLLIAPFDPFLTYAHPGKVNQALLHSVCLPWLHQLQLADYPGCSDTWLAAAATCSSLLHLDLTNCNLVSDCLVTLEVTPSVQ
jgi:hypothetical protein